jgi:uncharacterized protein YcbK (DUF882 family)
MHFLGGARGAHEIQILMTTFGKFCHLRDTLALVTKFPVMVFSFAIALLVAARVGGAAQAQAPDSHRNVIESLEGDYGSEPETFETFEMVALNTLETVVVRMRSDMPMGASETELAHVMRCLRTGRETTLDPKLSLLLFQIARGTGGTIELISGYRAPQHAHDKNYHSRAQAADIRVKGVSTAALFALARRLEIPGLGIYPTTGMIHIDVRDVPYHWVDYSGKSR